MVDWQAKSQRRGGFTHGALGRGRVAGQRELRAERHRLWHCKLRDESYNARFELNSPSLAR
jgi:hypothetical protein